MRTCASAVCGLLCGCTTDASRGMSRRAGQGPRPQPTGQNAAWSMAACYTLVFRRPTLVAVSQPPVKCPSGWRFCIHLHQRSRFPSSQFGRVCALLPCSGALPLRMSHPPMMVNLVFDLLPVPFHISPSRCPAALLPPPFLDVDGRRMCEWQEKGRMTMCLSH